MYCTKEEAHEIMRQVVIYSPIWMDKLSWYVGFLEGRVEGLQLKLKERKE